MLNQFLERLKLSIIDMAYDFDICMEKCRHYAIMSKLTWQKLWEVVKHKENIIEIYNKDRD